MNGSLLLIIALVQEPDSARVRQLFEQASAASTAFADRNAAIRAGYRRIGPDIPEMGEHWIKPLIVLEPGWDAARPAILTYLTVNGKPVLSGVAYALSLRSGERAPSLPGALHWHDHSAGIETELLSGIMNQPDAPRLAMLHVWTAIPNPEGAFVEGNWALPYVRVGLRPPARIDANSARALSLVTVGVEYYSSLLKPLCPQESARIDTLVNGTAQKVRAALTGDSDDAARDRLLADAWQQLTRDLLATLGDKAANAHVLLGIAHGGHQ